MFARLGNLTELSATKDYPIFVPNDPILATTFAEYARKEIFAKRCNGEALMSLHLATYDEYTKVLEEQKTAAAEKEAEEATPPVAKKPTKKKKVMPEQVSSVKLVELDDTTDQVSLDSDNEELETPIEAPLVKKKSVTLGDVARQLEG